MFGRVSYLFRRRKQGLTEIFVCCTSRIATDDFSVLISPFLEVGVITYILLCGYPPFYGDSDSEIFESVRVGRYDYPSPEWDEISQDAKDFIDLMLKKEPSER